jgi:hypothetical protein
MTAMRRWLTWGARLLVGIGLAGPAGGCTGCYSGEVAACAVTCSTDSDCPGAMACSQGLCAGAGVTCGGQDFRLITLEVSGRGLIMSGNEILCNGSNGDASCQRLVPPGAALELAAVAVTPDLFLGWAGGGCSGTGTCTVPSTGEVSISAGFGAPGQRLVHVDLAGTGAPLGARVVSDPAGIDCPALLCSRAFVAEQVVSLTPMAPSPDRRLDPSSWGNCDVVGQGESCDVPAGPNNVTVVYRFVRTPVLTVNAELVGGGSPLQYQVIRVTGPAEFPQQCSPSVPCSVRLDENTMLSVRAELAGFFDPVDWRCTGGLTCPAGGSRIAPGRRRQHRRDRDRDLPGDGHPDGAHHGVDGADADGVRDGPGRDVHRPPPGRDPAHHQRDDHGQQRSVIPGCTLGSLTLDAGLQRTFSCAVTITGSVAANLMLP